MLWIVVVLLPKGGSNFRGIEFLEPCWMIIKVLMYTRLATIEFHDCLHGFLDDRRTGWDNRGQADLAAGLHELSFIIHHPEYGEDSCLGSETGILLEHDMYVVWDE